MVQSRNLIFLSLSKIDNKTKSNKMNRLVFTFVILTFILNGSCTLKSAKNGANGDEVKITFIKSETNKKLEVLAGGKPFTTFQWPDNICKPVFYPIFASTGTEITRGFPVSPKPGERADHPHQIGMWLTYGNVNGNDFWGNGSEGLGTKNDNGGVIKHEKTEKISGGIGKGSFVSHESWYDAAGTELLKEYSEYYFVAKTGIRIIDRITTLTASEKEVMMPDTKEGMFGIRIARQLEHPVKGNVELYKADGTISKVKDTLNIGITGNYLSSEGVSGEAVWGTRARWMKLDGSIGEEKISVVICDHPKNPNYPTYWHARGYGLFSANPLGVKDFTKGAENLNFSVPAGKSVTFRYRVIIFSGDYLSPEEIRFYADEFVMNYI
jgi:hypothetical protein